MSTPTGTPEYEPWDFAYLTRVEPVTNYIPGGFHPVHLGDVLHNRYRIAHKLGFGSYATIWLAQDLADGSSKALKILASDSTLDTEAEILAALQHPWTAHSPAPPHKDFLLTLRDRFSLTGPNGLHQVLVTDVAGGSVLKAGKRQSRRFFSIQVARMMTAQLILGIRFLHSRGVIHGGESTMVSGHPRSLPYSAGKSFEGPLKPSPLDLHTGNILLSYPRNLDHLTVTELYDVLGQPVTQEVKLNSGEDLGWGFPRYEVEGGSTFVPCQKVTPETSRIVLCDFGEAFIVGSANRLVCHTPPALAPPESLLDVKGQIGPAADVWTAACAIYEFFSNQYLFDGGYWPDEESVIADIVNALGYSNVPAEWKTLWEKREDYIDDQGSWIEDSGENVPLAKRITDMRQKAADDFDTVERNAFTDMLMGMLTYRPEDRLTAAQLCACKWMRAYGLPSLKQLPGFIDPDHRV